MNFKSFFFNAFRRNPIMDSRWNLSLQTLFKYMVKSIWLGAIIFILFENFSYANSTKPITLSLKEAILLAVRSNPNVQQSQLNYVSQKFNLWVQQWQFYPHYAFEASVTKGSADGFDVKPSVSLLTPVGAQFTLGSANNSTNHFHPGLSLQVMQPLMRGFGKAVVEAALNNAKDTEVISRLTVEGTLRSTVTAVINAYLDVVSAERTVQIDEEALVRAQKSVEQTKLFIKAGHKAGNELVTVEANVASARTLLENDKNNLTQARYALLTAIGVDPNTEMGFTTLNLDELMKKYHLPTLQQTKRLILENDIQYQVDQITLHGATTRNFSCIKARSACFNAIFAFKTACFAI